VSNNPTNLVDPSGHLECSKEDLECVLLQKGTEKDWTVQIKNKYGISVTNNKNVGTDWKLRNLKILFDSLRTINNKLNGNLQSFTQGHTFSLDEFVPYDQNDDGQYGSVVHDDDTKENYADISLTTKGLSDLRELNIFHEVGHLIDLVKQNVFSDLLDNTKKGGATPSWVKDGYVDRTLLGDKYLEPVQSQPRGESYNPSEYWADAFANYVSGNIRYDGKLTTDFVSNALDLYIAP